MEIEITRTGSVGQGVGSDDKARIFFVPGALPGDRVRIEANTARPSRYYDAELVEVLRESTERRKPLCPVFGECGGCDWQHWEYAAQLRAKDEQITHLLEKVRLKPVVRLPILGASEEFGYRNRIQVSRSGEHLGFYRKKTKSVVDVQYCAIAHPRLNEAMQELRRDLSNVPGRLELSLTESGEVRTTSIENYGLDFVQVNPVQNQHLRRVVAEWMHEIGAGKVVELFCGDGNLTRGYVESVQSVLGIDSSELCLSRAQKAFVTPPEGKRSPVWLCSKVSYGTWASIPREWQLGYDTLLLDPPRQGIGGCLKEWLHGGLRSVVYVSCCPTTFIHDAILLRDRGFRLAKLQGIDMFPQTRHIELCSLFLR